MRRTVVAAMAAFTVLSLAMPLHASVNACAASKKLCVAKKLAALLKCHSDHEKPRGLTAIKFAACIQKAKDKFDGGTKPATGCFAKLEARFPRACLTTGDTAALEAKIDAVVDEIVCDLDSESATCPIPTATPTPPAQPTATTTPMATCMDDILNGAETDIDCGGGTCPPCQLGGVCAATSDCVATTNCVATTCVCAAGRQDCDASPANGCEVNVAGDPANCGACGSVCLASNATTGCTASTCTIASCNAAFANCNGLFADGCEINTTNSAGNCGGCGIVCSVANATPACTASTCTVATCLAGFADCNASPGDGCEVNTQSNNLHCGGCTLVCAGTCTGGTCLKPNGSVCSANPECQSGACADGMCCGVPCNGLCQACSAAKKGGGADGTCANIGAGTDPDNECPGAQTCNGAGACQ